MKKPVMTCAISMSVITALMEGAPAEGSDEAYFAAQPRLDLAWDILIRILYTYGKLGLKASKEERVYLARLYWLTIEFGLVDTPAGRRLSASFGNGKGSRASCTLACSM